jgi:hypothetical protein
MNKRQGNGFIGWTVCHGCKKAPIIAEPSNIEVGFFLPNIEQLLLTHIPIEVSFWFDAYGLYRKIIGNMPKDSVQCLLEGCQVNYKRWRL